MSQQVCAEFFAKVNTDTALQQEVNASLEGKEGMEAAQAFAWVGAKHGYEFTAEEAAHKYQEIFAAADAELDEEALDEEALEKVAAGSCCWIDWGGKGVTFKWQW